jgi:hypothetical protein
VIRIANWVAASCFFCRYIQYYNYMGSTVAAIDKPVYRIFTFWGGSGSLDPETGLQIRIRLLLFSSVASRWHEKSLSSKFFAWYIYISLQSSHKTVYIKAVLHFLIFGGRIWIRTDNNYRSGFGSGSGKHKSYGSGSGSGSGALRQTLLPLIFTCVLGCPC